jgi:hypothetical protein
MNSHDVTVAGFLIILSALIATDIAGRRPGSRIPTFSQVFTRIMRTRTGRVGILVAWAWLGLHFFAK